MEVQGFLLFRKPTCQRGWWRSTSLSTRDPTCTSSPTLTCFCTVATRCSGSTARTVRRQRHLPGHNPLAVHAREQRSVSGLGPAGAREGVGTSREYKGRGHHGQTGYRLLETPSARLVQQTTSNGASSCVEKPSARAVQQTTSNDAAPTSLRKILFL